MIKRLMLIGLVALTLVPFSRTKANACEPTLLAFYGICFEMDISDFFIEAGSVKVDSILKKLKNADTTDPSYEATLFITGVLARCKNPAGKVDVLNNGKPFNPNVTLEQSQAITPQQITKNGSALSEIIFTDDEIKAAVEAALATDLDALCKQKGNPWSLDKLAVVNLQLVGTLFTCANGGDQTDPRDLQVDDPELGACRYPTGTGAQLAGQLAIQDALGKQCVVPLGQDPFKPPFKYSCTTVCSGVPGTDATDPCPQTDTGPLPTS
jgi:hypothetical protein